jgi:hypothetical protein
VRTNDLARRFDDVARVRATLDVGAMWKARPKSSDAC